MFAVVDVQHERNANAEGGDEQAKNDRTRSSMCTIGDTKRLY